MHSFKKVILAGLFFAASAFTRENSSFEQSQKTFSRVKDAYERKESSIFKKCRSLSIPELTFSNIFIRVFKMEELLQVWVQKPDGKYVLFDEYKIYAHSGRLGPKREQGDAQVPEGFYYISDFNPESNYHLSLGINYPNESDRKLSKARNLGGDIYIHGGAVSAGCLAMSNYYIEDIYICAVKARSHGQERIPVHIFPFKLTSVNLDYYSHFQNLQHLKKGWKNLAEGYQYFETNRQVPVVEVAANGTYRFLDSAAAQ